MTICTIWSFYHLKKYLKNKFWQKSSYSAYKRFIKTNEYWGETWLFSYFLAPFKLLKVLKGVWKLNLLLILAEYLLNKRSCCKIITNYLNCEFELWPGLYALILLELTSSINFIGTGLKKLIDHLMLQIATKVITNCDGLTYYKLKL